MAEVGYRLLQVNTSHVLGNVTYLKGELPVQIRLILRNVS